ncbi:MAG: TetR/AcrR family transcriptional regulator [Oscillochloridaceae bacterium]|nr:TetR/AcrR family transcriptional regulator [Chloroflexaceae bacterium]MDW8388916.1 TetR/AcrR family transcriptional regulator [Oscillochloridaceae bacterium]
MTHSLRERRRQMLREEILEATHQLLTERGYAAMSMDELAARVGVSKPTLYNQFPTKEDLIAAMATQLIERMLALVAGERSASPLERLLRFLHTSVRLQVEHRTSTMQLWLPEIVDLLERHPHSRACLKRIDETIVATFHEAIQAGEIDPGADVPSLVRVYYALSLTPSVGRLSIVDEPDAERLADTVVDLFRRGLPRPASPVAAQNTSD